MSHYVVGDIQGCYTEFRQLLDLIAFDRTRDRLWLVGDLVNRGPDSLSVLRTVKSLGDAAPTRWDDSLTGYDRLRVIVNACTRLRFCAGDDTMNLAEKRGPVHAPAGFAPWFAHPARQSRSATILCGHWSTLELMLAPNVMMLDSGCLWGGTLTAVRLDDRRVFQIPSSVEVARKPLA